MPGKVAYIMSRFPHLPETFILREMIALEKLGWQVSLYPLIIQDQTLVHAEAENWVKRAHKLPWLSFDILMANARQIIKQPGKYFSTLWQVIRENAASMKFLARALLLFPKAVRMAECIQSEAISHIHAHYATHPALVAWIIHRLTGIPYSVTVHAHDIYVEKVMLGTKLRAASFIAAISKFNINYLVRFVGPWVREKAHIIRCGIDPEYYRIQTTVVRGHERFEIISVGSLQPYKGHEYLLRACARLRDWKIPFRCRIIGGGDLQALLAELVRENNLEGKVELLGPRTQDEVSRLLQTASCYVQPSIITDTGKMEGIPVALMEAMASEIPVLATSISGIPELVKDGETGWLVPPEDAQVLADTLACIYGDPAEAHKRALSGRRWVLDEFELFSNTKKLSSLFAQSSLSPSLGQIDR